MRLRLLPLMLAVLAGCGRESMTPSAVNEDVQLAADAVGYGVELFMTRAGVLTAVLRADTAYTYNDERRYDLTGVHVVFNTEQGAEAGTLTSDFGDYNQAEQLFIARKNVVLITPGPEGERRLETEELHYEIARDHIWTNSPFTLYEAGRVSRGTSFRTDSKFTTWYVTGITTEGTVAEGQGNAL